MPKRVLVVDDSPAVALALKLYFKRDGRYVVADSATTAAEGLALLGNDYDAVLLDLHLPDGSGVTLVRAFRGAVGDVPLILYSASDDTAEVDAVRGLVDAVARKSDVDEIAPSAKSAMPEGLFNSLTLEEIADLFAYLYASPASRQISVRRQTDAQSRE